MNAGKPLIMAARSWQVVLSGAYVAAEGLGQPVRFSSQTRPMIKQSGIGRVWRGHAIICK